MTVILAPARRQVNAEGYAGKFKAAGGGKGCQRYCKVAISLRGIKGVFLAPVPKSCPRPALGRKRLILLGEARFALSAWLSLCGP